MFQGCSNELQLLRKQLLRQKLHRLLAKLASVSNTWSMHYSWEPSDILGTCSIPWLYWSNSTKILRDTVDPRSEASLPSVNQYWSNWVFNSVILRRVLGVDFALKDIGQCLGRFLVVMTEGGCLLPASGGWRPGMWLLYAGRAATCNKQL